MYHIKLRQIAQPKVHLRLLVHHILTRPVRGDLPRTLRTETMTVTTSLRPKKIWPIALARCMQLIYAIDLISLDNANADHKTQYLHQSITFKNVLAMKLFDLLMPLMYDTPAQTDIGKVMISDLRQAYHKQTESENSQLNWPWRQFSLLKGTNTNYHHERLFDSDIGPGLTKLRHFAQERLYGVMKLGSTKSRYNDSIFTVRDMDEDKDFEVYKPAHVARSAWPNRNFHSLGKNGLSTWSGDTSHGNILSEILTYLL